MPSGSAKQTPMLVPAAVLTSKKTANPNDPNNIANQAIYLLNQSSADTKYDAIPEPRVGEGFNNMPTHLETSQEMFFLNNPFPLALGTVGILLVFAGIFL